MIREAAQLILQAYRPNTEDAHDPQFKEALALARQDPVLARWFAEEQALDAAFAAKLRSRGTPEDLKAQLLLARATEVRRAGWRQPIWLAVAAAVAVLCAVIGRQSKVTAGKTDLAAFQGAMADVALEPAQHVEAFGLDAVELKQWLTAHRGHPDFVLPPKLASHGVMGCKVVEWQGHRVTLLCMKFDGGHADVFVADAADLPAVVVGNGTL
ncbi:MAG: hypothetical protein ABIQ12_13390, partial [Opitutaceae bacterium]